MHTYCNCNTLQTLQHTDTPLASHVVYIWTYLYVHPRTSIRTNPCAPTRPNVDAHPNTHKHSLSLSLSLSLSHTHACIYTHKHIHTQARVDDILFRERLLQEELSIMKEKLLSQVVYPEFLYTLYLYVCVSMCVCVRASVRICTYTCTGFES